MDTVHEFRSSIYYKERFEPTAGEMLYQNDFFLLKF